MNVQDVASAMGLGALTDSGSAGRKVADLGSQDFMRLLIEQLRHQDPLDPVGGTDFLAQTAQFSSVEGLSKLNTTITQLLAAQQLTEAASLIGKRVSYLQTGEAGLQSNVVNAVNVVDGKVQLSAGADTIDLSQVRGVTL